jgi:ectoine hydroxylase-related dioxygenase (phytanoyl-CoA dioxygenase family)
MSLPQDTIDAFHRDGYLYAGPVLTQDELDAARAAYDRILKSEEKPESFRDLTLNDPQAKTVLSVHQVIDMWRLDPIFHTIIAKPAIVDIAEALMGTGNIRLYHDQALFKPAFHGGEVPWHQDNGYWNLEPATAVSCWLTLDDVTPDNGCMWVIPGSHLHGDASHEQAGASESLKTIAVDASTAVPLPMPAGCAMFHHCRTLHHTLPNLTPRQRRAFAIHYMAAETTQKGESLAERLLLRGEPVTR